MADKSDPSGALERTDPISAVTSADLIEAAATALREAWQLSCTGRSDQALNQALSLWREAAGRDDLLLQAHCSSDIAWYCFQVGLAEQGYSHAQMAVEFWASQHEPVKEAKARALAAWLLLELGFIEEATDQAMLALGLAEAADDVKVYSLALNVTGVMFGFSKQADRAIDFCHRAVGLARELNDPTLLAWWLINLGCAYSAAGDVAGEYDDPVGVRTNMHQALQYMGEALVLSAAIGDTWAERLCRVNSAEFLIALEDFPGAEQHLLAVAGISGGNYERGRRHYLYTLGQTLIALERLDEAVDSLTECLELAEQSNHFEVLQHALYYLSEAHEKAGRLDLALAFYKRFHKAQLQSSADKVQQRARLAEILYETNKLRVQVDTERGRTRDVTQSYQELKLMADSLSEAAYIDPLTGLNNRRRLDLMLSEFELEAEPYTIVMVDLDHFKKINDGYSHLVGDQVLRQIGVLLRAASRSRDVAVRFGGEEFLLLLKGLGVPQAAVLCERLRQAVIAWDWASIAVGLSVTVSIGVADNSDSAGPSSILERADRRLYMAKHAGRDRIVWAG